MTFLEGILTQPIMSLTEIKPECCASSDDKECANCSVPEGQFGVKLLPCSRCKLVSYCGKACQAQHWKAGGHKQRCVAVIDRSAAAAQEASSSPVPLNSELCAVCREPLASDATRPLGCGHVLHSKCAEALLSSGAARVCPVCRKGL